MQALMNGEIEPTTLAQKRFIEVCQATKEPITKLEILWRRYLNQLRDQALQDTADYFQVKLTGNTFAIKDELKKKHFKWLADSGCWTGFLSKQDLKQFQELCNTIPDIVFEIMDALNARKLPLKKQKRPQLKNGLLITGHIREQYQLLDKLETEQLQQRFKKRVNPKNSRNIDRKGKRKKK